MSSPLISFEDVDIYQNDHLLLHPNSQNWLNDRCISYILHKHSYLYHDSRIFYLEPTLVMFLRIQCDINDWEEILESLKLQTFSIIMIPLTNCQHFNEISSHWSLLFIHLDDNKIYHLDSHRSYNYSSAISFSKLFSSFMKRDFGDIIEVECPQQSNGYDCGIYVVLFVEILTRGFKGLDLRTPLDRQTLTSLVSKISINDPMKCRQRWYDDIATAIGEKT